MSSTEGTETESDAEVAPPPPPYKPTAPSNPGLPSQWQLPDVQAPGHVPADSSRQQPAVSESRAQVSTRSGGKRANGADSEKPPPAALPASKARTGGGKAASRRPAGAITMRTLVDSGILKPGLGILCVEYKGTKVVADLTGEGQIKFEGMLFESPSAFSVFTKRQVNPSRRSDDGWKSVRCNGRVLETYKDDLLRLLPPSGSGAAAAAKPSAPLPEAPTASHLALSNGIRSAPPAPTPSIANGNSIPTLIGAPLVVAGAGRVSAPAPPPAQPPSAHPADGSIPDADSNKPPPAKRIRVKISTASSSSAQAHLAQQQVQAANGMPPGQPALFAPEVVVGQK